MMNRSSKWKASQRIEIDYLKSLFKIVRFMVRIAHRSKDIIDYQMKMREFQESKSFRKFSSIIARKMVLPLSDIEAKHWREAANKSMRGKMFYRLLMKNIKGPIKDSVDSQVKRNASIIQTLPLTVSMRVTKEVQEESMKGLRASTIATIIKDKTDQYSRSSAKLIARTEVSKTQTALTRARSENVGVNWYMWTTAKDNRVREAHENMDEVLINWRNPPSPEAISGLPEAKGNSHYHAGEIYNCRCFPFPIYSLEDVSFPAKVYYGGKIVKMNKKEFQKIM